MVWHSLNPFRLLTWGTCARRGRSAFFGDLPHNTLSQHPTKCAWCGEEAAG